MKRKTSPSRFRRGLKTIAEWCRLNRHQPLADQHQTLCQKLTGHFAYYGITATRLRCLDSAGMRSESGGNGSRGVTARDHFVGSMFTGCWSDIRSRRR